MPHNARTFQVPHLKIKVGSTVHKVGLLFTAMDRRTLLCESTQGIQTQTSRGLTRGRTDGRTHSYNLPYSPSPSPLVTWVSSSRPQRHCKLQVSSLRLLPPRIFALTMAGFVIYSEIPIFVSDTHEIFRLKSTLYIVQSRTLQKKLVTAGAAPLIFCILYFMTYRCLN